MPGVRDYNARLAELFAGDVCVDGSCDSQWPRSFTTRATAPVVVDSRGETVASVCGEVGKRLPQTSPAGEYMELWAAVQASAVPKRIHANYTGVAQVPGAISHDRLRRGGVHRSPKRLIAGHVNWRAVRAVRNVAAHQDSAVLPEGLEDQFRAKGNKAADQWAEREATMHCWPSLMAIAAVLRRARTLPDYLWFLTHLLPRWSF